MLLKQVFWKIDSRNTLRTRFKKEWLTNYNKTNSKHSKVIYFSLNIKQCFKLTIQLEKLNLTYYFSNLDYFETRVVEKLSTASCSCSLRYLFSFISSSCTLSNLRCVSSTLAYLLQKRWKGLLWSFCDTYCKVLIFLFFKLSNKYITVSLLWFETFFIFF